MVDLDRRFIFIHVPKTGGLSVYKYFKISTDHQGHATLSEDLTSCAVDCKDFYKFAFFRNPFDRFVSCYHYFKGYGRQLGPDVHDGHIVNKFSSFRDFTLNFEQFEKDLLGDHWRQQVYWLDDRLDFVGRFENLEEDFEKVCKSLNIACTGLPHKNQSKHKHYKEYYDSETIEVIKKKYENDLKTLNYQF